MSLEKRKYNIIREREPDTTDQWHAKELEYRGIPLR